MRSSVAWILPKVERSTMTTYDLKQTGQLIKAMRGTRLFALTGLQAAKTPSSGSDRGKQAPVGSFAKLLKRWQEWQGSNLRPPVLEKRTRVGHGTTGRDAKSKIVA